MHHDRFLQGILIFILILVVAALGSYFLTQQGQTYLPETSPENVAHNYVLALQQKEFRKAYSYLQERDDTPSFSTFQNSFIRQRPSLSDTGVQIMDTSLQEDQAIIDMVIIHGGGDPFGNIWREEATALLIKEEQSWKISRFPPPYWGWDWEAPPRPEF